MYPLSDNAYWLVGVQLLDGVGAGIYGAIFPVIVADLMRGTGRFNVAQGAIITAQGIGAALSTALAGFVVVRAGYSAAFLTLAGVAVVGLFILIYAVGTVVTVLLSNDATAVVLTPAVYAATRAAGGTPLPYLLVCAFIANAASFVLPISNPANLVVFGGHMPHLAAWLAQFGLPSIISIGVTYLALRITQRDALAQEKIAREVPRPRLSRGGRLALFGIAAIALTLLSCSALDIQLGLPTFICGVVTGGIVLALNRQSPWPIIKGVSWGVLPLVAGLFVLVEALNHTGVITALSWTAHAAVAKFMNGATWGAGLIVGLASNLMNNLPVGLIVGSVVASDNLPSRMTGAMLIGVDLGPNLSVTGSLATILWLAVLRREGLEVGTWKFLRLGMFVMPPALVLSVVSMSLFG